MDIDVTPIHFYEAVKLLKTREFSITYDDKSLLISFKVESFETDIEQLKREVEISHLYDFLKELRFCRVPVDLSEFIQRYHPFSQNVHRRKLMKK